MRLIAKSSSPAPCERTVAVDWHDCAWSPTITVQTPALARGDVTKPLPVDPFLRHTARCHRTNFNHMKSILPSARRPRAGFTLIELLVVIAIIGILAAMLLPVLAHVVTHAKMVKAKTEAQAIAQAVEAYDSSYGRFPVSPATQTAAGVNDYTYGGSVLIGASFAAPNISDNSEVIAILMDNTQLPVIAGQPVNLNHQKNPKQTIFLNAKMSGDTVSPGVGTDLIYRDPWGNPYIISMDLNFDEQTIDAFYSRNLVSGFNQTSANPGLNGLVNPDTSKNDNFQYHGKVMVWSAGPDKTIAPGTPANAGVNKDNVTSW